MDFQTKPLSGTEHLTSPWSLTTDLTGSNPPVRLEGQISDLVVHGKIPDSINGTFYRISQDPVVPPHAVAVPIDGDGAVTAFRIRDGHVDFKIKYVETERYLYHKRAKTHFFGLYKNPWTDHPCVRAVVDSTANTNVVHWAGQLLAIRESACPYSLDPDTLETRKYDPFGDQIDAKAFTAHPKIDPHTDELVVFAYEAKGPATDDIVTYSIDRSGKVKNVCWVKSPYVTFIHDMALTDNWIVLLLWPFEASIDRMKSGGHHYAYNYNLDAAFIVVPRRPERSVAGWKPGEYRVYYTKNCMHGHTAGGWEEDNGKLYFEASRAADNFFPFFPSEDGRQPAKETQVDFVRYEVDLAQLTGAKVPEPRVLVDTPNEFARIDERFISKKYEIVVMNIFYPGHSDPTKNVFAGLNAVLYLNTRTGVKKTYWPGEHCYCQEPLLVPRSDTAPEGDGYVIFMVERRDRFLSYLVVLDTNDFEKPIAVADIPLRLRAQIHGNWVDAKELSGKPLIPVPEEIKISGKGYASYVDLSDAKPLTL